MNSVLVTMLLTGVIHALQKPRLCEDIFLWPYILVLWEDMHPPMLFLLL
jgi:hypothetical protein